MAGTRDDIARRDYGRHREPGNLGFVATLLAEHDATVRFGDAPSRRSASFAGDIELLLDALGNVGVPSPFVVDLGRSDVGIPVVKVVAPGLEPERDPLAAHAARLGPRGRRAFETGGLR
jgi:ribosomal protein S12 methylthiotransferase accessory factor